MFLIFVDDSKNINPLIGSMGTLISIGGFDVDADVSADNNTRKSSIYSSTLTKI